MKHIQLFEKFSHQNDSFGEAPIIDILNEMFSEKLKSKKSVIDFLIEHKAHFDDVTWEHLEKDEQAAVNATITENRKCEFFLSTQIKDLLIYVGTGSEQIRMNISLHTIEEHRLHKAYDILKAKFSK